jgi:hypothetical protein
MSHLVGKNCEFKHFRELCFYFIRAGRNLTKKVSQLNARCGCRKHLDLGSIIEEFSDNGWVLTLSLPWPCSMQHRTHKTLGHMWFLRHTSPGHPAIHLLSRLSILWLLPMMKLVFQILYFVLDRRWWMACKGPGPKMVSLLLCADWGPAHVSWGFLNGNRWLVCIS